MKYWAYINNEVLGPFEKEKLLELPDFSNSTMICQQSPVGEKTQEWREASTFPEIAALLSGANPIKDKPALNNTAIHSLKPISLSDIGNESIKENTNISGPTIEVSKLSSLGEKKQEKKEEVPLGSEKFDPISISEINKKTIPIGESKTSSNVEPLSLSQITKKQQDFTQNPRQMPQADTRTIDLGTNKQEKQYTSENQNISPISQENKIKSMETGENIQEKELRKEETEIKSDHIKNIVNSEQNLIKFNQQDNTQEIIKLIEKLASNTANKQDINDLKNYIDNKIDDVHRRIANISISDIDKSIKNIDNRLSNIESKINYIQNTANINNFSSPIKMETKKVETPANIPEKKEIPKNEKDIFENIDEKPKSKISTFLLKIIKVIFKIVFVIILVAAIIGVTIFALKQADIIDLTKFIPLVYFSQKGQNQTQENPQEVFSSTQNVVSSSQSIISVQNVEPPKDLSDEVIYFSRTYTPNNGNISIENSILSIAKKNKWKTQAISWEAKLKEGSIYSVNCIIPSRKGKNEFLFEIDYTAKNIKPINELAKYALDNLIPIKQEKKANKTKQNKKSYTPPKKEIKNEEQGEDEEYVYEYVDEDEANKEQEYVMPGIPKKNK